MSDKFKPIWGKPTITFDWCQYDGDGGMFTVRRITTQDAAKFQTKADAFAYMAQQEALTKGRKE